MTDQLKAFPESQEAAWWRRAIVQFNADAGRWLNRNYPSLQHLHQDLVGETLLQLTAYLSTAPKSLPAEWFQLAGPVVDEEWRFRAFALTVLKRRVMDHFRADFRLWVREFAGNRDEAGAPEAELAVENQEAGDELDLVRTCRALLIMMAKLPDRDRLLMEEQALGGRDAPLDPGERQRLHRLRLQLLNELAATLGQDPKQFLRQL